MDINQLTDELFNRAPTLAKVLRAPSRETCRAVILAAVDSSNSLELLLGHGVDDAVLGVVADLREAREHGLVRSEAYGAAVRPAMQPDSDSARPLAPARPVEVWAGPDVSLSASECHASTLRPSIAVGQ